MLEMKVREMETKMQEISAKVKAMNMSKEVRERGVQTKK